MNDQSKSAEPRDQRVEVALREYLERVDRGEPVDRDEFLARHAPIAEQLRSFITAEEDVRKLAAAGAETPQDHARDSTKSFVGHGQETVLPQSMVKGNVLSGTRGLEGRFGRYRIIRTLGKGAMGTVYLAEDTQIERQVALKTPHFTEDPTGEQMERFFREARAAGNLRHPNICPIYDFGQIDGRHFITMAYIEGRPLSAFIQPDNQQAERQILLLVRKLASALQEAHDQGVVHRDLKPANIMVDKKGEPIIMDFGLAQQTRRNEDVRLTQTGHILGTPAFMSPEQVEGEPEKIGPPTDEYSLGVILYELLTGELPFRGSLTAVMAQILTKAPPPPSQLRPDLDPRIEAACLKMMAKNPSDRFASLKAAADEFASILKSPAAKAASKEKAASSPAPLPAGDRMRADVGASQVLKSLKQMTLSEKDLESLEELARKCYSRRDFEQVIQIIERVPEKRRIAALKALLEESRAKADEISFLICDIDEAERLNDRQRALAKADELLAIKPGHHRAREIHEKYSGYGEGNAARIGPLWQFTQPWNEGGWIPWSVLAFGLAVFGGMTAIIVIWLGRTAIVIDAKDAGIEVTVKGKSALITVPGEQSIKVEPGEQELKVSYAGLETQTKRFSLKRNETKKIEVWIAGSKLVARLENEILELTPAPDKQERASKGAEQPPENKPQENEPPDNKPQKPLTVAGLGKVAPTERAVAPALLVAPFDEGAARIGQQQWAEHLKSPIEFINSIGVKLVLIPPGEFQMGSSPEQLRPFLSEMLPARRKSATDAQSPQYRVRITRPFHLGAHEVTRAQFAQFVRATGYKTEAERDGRGSDGFQPRTGRIEHVKQLNWRNLGFAQADSHPVVDVSWNDAQAFCEWLSTKEGKVYRLPTDAEWEYACRAGTTTAFSNGDDPRSLVTVGNILDAAWAVKFGNRDRITVNDGYAVTAPVGSFHPNAFQLYDMHGNVWEWCHDRYDKDYYAHSPETDPTGASAGDRVMRGGAFDCPARYCLSATRGSAEVSERVANLGFRVACTTATPSTPEFVPLFNGRDLSGWKTHPSQPGNWRVENGVLIGFGSGPSDLYTERGDFRDFHLRVEARINAAGNSGLFGRASFGPRWPAKNPQWPWGYEAQIESVGQDRNKTGSLYIAERGAVVQVKESPVPAGEWFTEELIIQGNQIVIQVNGKTTADYLDRARRFESGHLALQQHDPQTVVEFRKIEIKELGAPKSATSIPSQSADGALTTPFNATRDLIVNGSFEEGPPSRKFVPLNPGSTAITGWTVTRGQIDYVGKDHWKAADGDRSIDLHGSPGYGGIKQTFKTTKGQRYRVTFSLAGSPQCKHPIKRIAVEAAGAKGVYRFDSTGKTWEKMGWVRRSFEFKAVSDETTLEIYTLEKRDPIAGPALDDVQVTEVPQKK